MKADGVRAEALEKEFVCCWHGSWRIPRSRAQGYILIIYLQVMTCEPIEETERASCPVWL